MSKLRSDYLSKGGEMAAGDYVECIKACVMSDGEVSTTKGKKYRIIALNRDISEFAITDDVAAGHWFDIVDCEWFNTNGGQATLSKTETVQPKLSVYTQAMAENNIPPSVGSSFLVGRVDGDSRILEFEGKFVTVVSTGIVGESTIITFKHDILGYGCGVFMPFWVLPVLPATERERVIDGILYDIEDRINNCDDAKDAAKEIYSQYIK